jgi:hypothetical protein
MEVWASLRAGLQGKYGGPQNIPEGAMVMERMGF